MNITHVIQFWIVSFMFPKLAIWLPRVPKISRDEPKFFQLAKQRKSQVFAEVDQSDTGRRGHWPAIEHRRKRGLYGDKLSSISAYGKTMPFGLHH
jgi:hypothetical protein